MDAMSKGLPLAFGTLCSNITESYDSSLWLYVRKVKFSSCKAHESRLYWFEHQNFMEENGGNWVLLHAWDWLAEIFFQNSFAIGIILKKSSLMPHVLMIRLKMRTKKLLHDDDPLGGRHFVSDMKESQYHCLWASWNSHLDINEKTMKLRNLFWTVFLRLNSFEKKEKITWFMSEIMLGYF